MSTLREDVYNSVINLHRKNDEEWIPLKEIYAEVSRVRGETLKNGGASVRATLETHSILSEAFSGKEEYILKEKGSGLYKSFYYDQLVQITNLNIGDVFTRDQLISLFKISGQSGIMKTNTLNCLVLTTSENNGVYNDSLVENGLITYTGEGLMGDQTITKNNKSIYESGETELPMYLFSKDKNRKYIFEGQVELYDEPYQSEELDSKGNNRLVWKFPLKVVYCDERDFHNDEKYKELVYEITEIENSIELNELPDIEDLEYREGLINIRKYRRKDKEISRNSKPDYIAEEIIKDKQGKINERLIYEKELKRLMNEEAKEQIKMMEDFFNNKKENEGFDILSFELDDKGKYTEKYIEVKSTKGNEGTPIDITINEIEFAKAHIDRYYLYRIINSDSDQRYLKIVKGKELFNDDNYNFIPISFKIYSN